MPTRQLTPPPKKKRRLTLLNYYVGSIADNNVREEKAYLIRNWLRGATAHRKFVTLRKAMITLQANFRRKSHLKHLSDGEEDRLLHILELFIKYLEQRLQETEDALFDAITSNSNYSIRRI